MKRLSLIVFLVCLTTSGVYATNTWNYSNGYWNVNQYPNGLAPGTVLTDTTYWSSKVVPADTEQVKIARAGTTCILDANAGTFNSNKVTVGQTGTTPILDIVSGGLITINTELQVGDSGGKAGIVNQTGGTVTVGGSGKLSVGYKSSGSGRGDYTISDGGTISGSSGSQLNVGYSTTGVPGSLGVFTVQGGSASITVGTLYVGWNTDTSGTTADGTLAFAIQSGAVSYISAGTVNIDQADVNTVISRLTVTGTPTGNVVLVDNTGTNPVHGVFDYVTIPSGYTLTYTYDKEGDGKNNDIALIPEPATIALFGLGLLALVRRPRRK